MLLKQVALCIVLQCAKCTYGVSYCAVAKLVYMEDAGLPDLARDHFIGSVPNNNVSPSRGMLQVQSPVGRGRSFRSAAGAEAARHRRVARAICCQL